MADDKNNPSNPPAEDLPAGDDPKGGQPAPKGDDGSSNPPVDSAEQARRDQQSKKDKLAADKDDTKERIDFLEAREMERVRDETVKNFLSENSDKFPDVQANDPLFKHAGSEEAVEEIATEIQNRYKDAQQKALESVQVGTDNSLTDEEIAEQEKLLEKEANDTGQSRFSGFIGNLQRRKKA